MSNSMRYENDRVTGINIAYIGGGSRGWAWTFMGDLAAEESLSGTVRLYDIDFEAAHDNMLIGNRLIRQSNSKGKWNFTAVNTLEKALDGADFVIISILPGTFKEMWSDVHTPEKYGIYQSVGDTVGPGGLIRAIRTIPMYVEIAEAIKKYSPDAWVINYTNPMTLCTRTLYEVFPGIKAFGCCHEVFGTQELLADMLYEMKGIDGIKRHQIEVNVLGINHFTWLDSASYKGIDLMPLYIDFVDKYYEEGYEGANKGHWINNFFASANRVKFDLFKRYGLIAAAGDRHLAEFMPPWYLKDPETIKSWKFGLTPVSWRMENRKMQDERRKRLIDGKEQIELKASGEEGVAQIKALLGLGNLITNVNLPNKGQMEGIPVGAVVETNALFARNSVRPVIAGRLPSDIESLVMRHVLNQETILKAALKRDKELAFRAFLNDPLMVLDINDARKLFDEMLYNTREYLQGWNI